MVRFQPKLLSIVLVFLYRNYCECIQHSGFEEIAAGFGRMTQSIERMVDVEETGKRLKVVEERMGGIEAQQAKMLQILEELNKKN